jgi:Predicted Fe-S-cluster oxidoreductase
MPERLPVKTRLIASADPERLETWVRYSAGLCRDCHATCCTLPVEVRIDDLIRLELVDAFERDEPAKNIAKRLSKAGIVEHFNHKHEIFTLTRLTNGDCLYLDRKTRLCTVYAKRPDTAATTHASARAPDTAPIAARQPAERRTIERRRRPRQHQNRNTCNAAVERLLLAPANAVNGLAKP